MKTMFSSLGGESLYKLSLSAITVEIINVIKKSCPNINFLNVKITNADQSQDSIQSTCDLSSLKILRIGVGNAGSLASKIFADHLTSVEYLFLDFMIDLSSFEYFTKNCKAN